MSAAHRVCTRKSALEENIYWPMRLYTVVAVVVVVVVGVHVVQ